MYLYMWEWSGNEGEWGDGGCIYLMGKRKQEEYIEKMIK